MNKEPQRLGEVLGQVESGERKPLPELPEVAKEWGKRYKSFMNLADDDEWEKAPIISHVCWRCGNTFRRNAVLLATGPGLACDECCAGERANDETKPKRKGPTLDLPPQFLGTDVDHKNFPRSVWERVKDFDPRGGRGLVFIGDTGGGKTRLLCKVAQRVVMSYRMTARIFWPGEFQVAVAERLRSERSFAAWRRELLAVDFLAIDDLFANQMTERTEGALFDILDDRMRWEKPLGVTTQKNGDDVRGGARDPKRAEAFARRLRESCDLYVVETQTTFENMGPGGNAGQNSKHPRGGQLKKT